MQRRIIPGHIVVDTLEDQKLYEESINIITAVSRLVDIKVFLAESYQRNEKSIRDNAEQNCSVYLVINDEANLERARQKLEKKRAKAQKKLQDLIKMISNKKYSSEASEEQKLRDQEKVIYINLYFPSLFLSLTEIILPDFSSRRRVEEDTVVDVIEKKISYSFCKNIDIFTCK